MKKNYSFFTLTAIVVGILLLSFTFFYPSGSPGGYTGSPADGQNCTVCHGGTATSVSSFITTNIPSEGYSPDSTYNITVSYDSSNTSKGFELTCEDASNSKVGQFQVASGTKLVNNNHAVTHSADITTSNASWTFTWTAPAKGTGTVSFYSALVVDKPNIKLCSLAINEKATTALNETENKELKIYPNPAFDRIKIETPNDTKKAALIYNMKGQMLRTFNLNKKTNIDISNLPSGQYLIIINYKNKTLKKTFIKK